MSVDYRAPAGDGETGFDRIVRLVYGGNRRGTPMPMSHWFGVLIDEATDIYRIRDITWAVSQMESPFQDMPTAVTFDAGTNSYLPNNPRGLWYASHDGSVLVHPAFQVLFHGDSELTKKLSVKINELLSSDDPGVVKVGKVLAMVSLHVLSDAPPTHISAFSHASPVLRSIGRTSLPECFLAIVRASIDAVVRNIQADEAEYKAIVDDGAKARSLIPGVMLFKLLAFAAKTDDRTATAVKQRAVACVFNEIVTIPHIIFARILMSDEFSSWFIGQEWALFNALALKICDAFRSRVRIRASSDLFSLLRDGLRRNMLDDSPVGRINRWQTVYDTCHAYHRNPNPDGMPPVAEFAEHILPFLSLAKQRGRDIRFLLTEQMALRQGVSVDDESCEVSYPAPVRIIREAVQELKHIPEALSEIRAFHAPPL